MSGPARVRLGFLAGLVAGAAAGLVMLVARLALDVPSLPELLLDQLTALVPPAVFAFVLDLLKFLAKPLLMALVVAGQLLLSGAAGALYAWLVARAGPGARWRLALAVAAGLWLLGVLGLLPALGAGFFGAGLPVGPTLAAGSLLLAALAYGLTLASVDSWAEQPEPGAEGEPSPGRRALLRTLGWGAVAVAAGYFVLRGIGSLEANAAAARRSRRPGDELPPEVTPNKDFYVVSKNFDDPQVDVARWRLEITGLVERPVTLTYEELRALPAVEQHVTLECISNEVGGDLISNALWKGVRFQDLLQMAGPKPGARKVVLTAADAYEDSVTFDRAMSPANVLAYDMNGERLPPGHGFPARLLVPGIYGMKNVKWVTKIALVDYDFKGYWQQRGWSDEAYVKTMSRIDVPLPQLNHVAGPLQVGGIAFSGDRGIGRIEVSVDDGKTWRPATVRQALSPYTWVLWTLDWQAPVGRQQLLVRAADGGGQLQDSRETPTLPDGASGYHSIVVRVVES